MLREKDIAYAAEIPEEHRQLLDDIWRTIEQLGAIYNKLYEYFIDQERNTVHINGADTYTARGCAISPDKIFPTDPISAKDIRASNQGHTNPHTSGRETDDERMRLHNHLQLIRRLQNNDSDTVPPTRIAKEGCIYPEDRFLGHGLDVSKLNAHCDLTHLEYPPDPM